jgi:hypothetical protein
MMRPGMGSMLMGGIARRGAMGAVRRIMGAVGSRAASPTLGERAGRRAVQDGSAERATSVRVFRQAPAVGGLARAVSSGRPGHDLPAGTDRRAIEPSIQPAGAASRSWRDVQVGRPNSSQSGQARVIQGVSVSTSPAGRDNQSGRRRTVSVGIGGVSSTKSGVAVRGSTGATTSESGRRRAARESNPARSGTSRYEPRAQSHSASLRDGPSTAKRVRRRPPPASNRRFREYSSVTKDGVTVMVPAHR